MEVVKKNSFWDKSINVGNVVMVSGIVFTLGLGLGSSIVPLRNLSEAILLRKTAVSSEPTGDLSKQDFKLYWQVYNALQEGYVDPSKLDAQKMYYGSIRGMVEAIGDSPTVFFDPTETSNFKNVQSGTYSGIGAELDYVDKAVIVVAPFDGSPAQKAGIEPQDIISEVDGKTTANRTLNDVVMSIRGEAGTSVKITILRPRENYKKYEFSINRGNVSAPSMSLVEVKNGVAIVKISRFTEASYSEWVQKWRAIASIIKQKESSGEVKSILIDLRNNPGGYFDAAVYLAGDFLPKGTVVSYQRDRAGTDQEFKTANTPAFPKTPVVVLVNGSSASASEIFTGALKHYGRATVVGEETYGKGTAQAITDLQGGASMHITVSKWLLPDKGWINPENKIKPDKVVVFDYELKAKGMDNQMDAALELLTK